MSNNLPIQTNGITLTPVESPLFNIDTSKLLDDMPFKGFTIKPPEMPYIPSQEERMQPFLDRLDEQNELLEAQLIQAQGANTSLQKQLDDAYVELKQLNDKTSSQTYYIKQLKADLKEETERRIKAEDKLSSKDWKLALVALGGALIALGVEHWKDIYDFILSLIE